MDTTTLARAIRRRPLLILCAVGLGLAGAILGIVMSRPQYQSRVQLFVSAPEASNNVGAYQGSLFTQQRVVSYANVVANPPVLLPVIRELHLRMSPSELAGNVRAVVPSNTVLIDVFVTDLSPRRAQAIARLVGDSFIHFVQTLEQPIGTGRTPIAVHVSRPADLPTTPVKPKKKLLILIGLLLGAVVGIGAAAILEALDTSVKDVDDLEVGSGGLVRLGEIPFDSVIRGNPLATLTAANSFRAEALRQIRTNLQFISVDSPPNSVVFTSALRGEGKSTTAAGVARAFGQAGVRTVLVEADLRLPSQSRYLGLTQSSGLSDVLLGRTTIGEALQEVGDEGASMSVLSSGTLPPMPSELLASERMATLLRELEATFDMVVIDTPPLLPVADASILSRITDGVILVVQAGKTSRKNAHRALDMLRTVDARVLGVAMNMVSSDRAGEYYRGHYGAVPVGGQ